MSAWLLMVTKNVKLNVSPASELESLSASISEPGPSAEPNVKGS